MLTPLDDLHHVDTCDAHDANRMAPYLLRYYASVGNPRASVLRELIFDMLIGQITWPRGSMRRVMAVLKVDKLRRYGARPDFSCESDADEDDIDLSAIPTSEVDTKLIELGDFRTGLKQLYAADPMWLRGVLQMSLKRAGARQNAADGKMWDRLQQVGDVFGWKPAALQLARIGMHAGDIPELAEWLDSLPAVGRDAARAYKRVLSSDVAALRQVLQPNSQLNCSGLVVLERPHDRPFGLTDPPRLHPKLAAAISEDSFRVGELSRFLFSQAPSAGLSDDDFTHLKAEYEPLTKLLQTAVNAREPGVNILIYGPPGTGKTEFARWLVAHASLCAFEVPATDSENDSASTRPVSDRLALLRSAHWLMRSAAQTALIFDEAEDAFPREASMWLGSTGMQGGMQGPRKGWVNQLLEQTPLPTIWISNAVDQMDPAYLRRFTYHLEMRCPSQRVRERIASQRAVLHGLPVSVAAPLGTFADASPAMVDSALRFARLACIDDNPQTQASTQAELATRSLRAGLQAAGLKVHGDTRTHQTTYDPSFINLRGGVDATSLLQSLQRTRASNICFYGAPGTGKTSFAEHIAHELDRPLMIRRASDLQSMWLGETEKRMRKSFEEAQSENAVLLIDEADSFLGDRSGARHSWERSQVNELLQCMERFEGIFIAATNLIDTFDKAALRRFTHKIEFLPLTLDQSIAMFRQQLGDVELPEIRWAHLRAKLARLDGLTAGDFGVVARQAQMRLDAMTAEEVIAALAIELQLRSPMRGRAMGFA